MVISVSDPQAALGLDKFKVFRPLYDTMLMIDRHSPLILGYDVLAHSQDTALLVPTLERTRQLTGRLPNRVAVDAGFVTALNPSPRVRRTAEQILDLQHQVTHGFETMPSNVGINGGKSCVKMFHRMSWSIWS